MGKGIIVVENEVFARIRDRVTVVGRPVKWCERMTYAVIETTSLPDGLPWVQDVIIDDDGSIQFRTERDV